MYEYIQIEGSFPAVITPSHHLRIYADCKKFIIDHKTSLQQLLLKHGALLFRGWPIQRAKDFADIIHSLGLGKFVNYIGGDSPRNKVHDHIYTSTEAPPSFHIPLHQELSFIKKFPRHIYFFL